MKSWKSWGASLLILWGIHWGHVQGASPSEQIQAPSKSAIKLDTLSVFGATEAIQQLPGSAHVVDSAELERFAHDDAHRVLQDVPGVYIREEEGFGLRPNIGMRGSGSERSAKIALLEDGVLIAPAPYSAPAAYYFPTMARIERVEVLKGPAAISQGPNTVGGALNLISRSIPLKSYGKLSMSAGDFASRKFHAFYGDKGDSMGWLLEGVHLASAGFQQIDGGHPSGFDKNDLLFKFRWNTPTEAIFYQQWDVKISQATETSNSSYAGLTDADFRHNPYRRYASTQDDQMQWQHRQYEVRYSFNTGSFWDASIIAYRNLFERVWTRLNDLQGGNLREVLAHPETSQNQVLYGILSGERPGSTLAESLGLIRNDRRFVSEGLQFLGHSEWEAGGRHETQIGLRWHRDEIRRFHTERYALLDHQELRLWPIPKRYVAENRASAQAWALHLLDTWHWEKWQLSPGLRYESVSTEFEDHLAQTTTRHQFEVFIPGMGLFYQATRDLGWLAGIHKGFVPVSPGQQGKASPEESLNYEFGARWQQRSSFAEAIGFFNDYSNLKGSCTFSSGCTNESVDQEFDGGRVHVYGLEARWQTRFLGSAGMRYPLSLVYTYTRSDFQTAFQSENPQWGEIRVGDELPYLPQHLLLIKSGIRRDLWEVNLAGHYTSEMRDHAGQGKIAPGERIPPHTIYDLAMRHREPWGQGWVSFNVENLLDTVYISSRQPFGLRPGKPRLAQIGYQLEFK